MDLPNSFTGSNKEPHFIQLAKPKADNCMEHECKKEFPNYFNFLAPDEARGYTEQALRSILSRLEIPYISPKKGKLTNKHFMRSLNKEALSLAPEAKFYISGGVVRSLLGYIYKKCYNAHQRYVCQEGSIDETAMRSLVQNKLLEIIQGRSWKHTQVENKPLPSLRALGINSDLDILGKFPSTFCGNKSEIEHKLTDFINSAETYLDLRNDQTQGKKSILPIGDVKDYDQQLGRYGKRSAVNQGGSSLDWLAFPIDSHDQSGMQHPEGFPHIFDFFLSGRLQYIKAPDGMRDLAKQTIRGLRPLLEVPFAEFDPESSQILQTELQQLKKAGLSTGAQEQIDKLKRNARFQGAHNRFVDLSKEMPNPEINALAHEISAISGKSLQNQPLFPEFLEHKPISPHRGDKGNLARDNKLMPLHVFLEKCTDNGVLYHGTPEVHNILYMIRNGLIVSSKEQGRAVFGRGTYTTGISSIAKGYAGDQGLVIPLSVNVEKPLRIVNLQSNEGRDLLAEIKQRYPESDPFAMLAKHYDVDIIIPKQFEEEHYGIVILQNAASVKTQIDVKALINTRLEDLVKQLIFSIKRDRSFPDIFNDGYYKLMCCLDANFSLESMLSAHEDVRELISNQLARQLMFCIENDRPLPDYSNNEYYKLMLYLDANSTLISILLTPLRQLLSNMELSMHTIRQFLSRSDLSELLLAVKGKSYDWMEEMAEKALLGSTWKEEGAESLQIYKQLFAKGLAFDSAAKAAATAIAKSNSPDGYIAKLYGLKLFGMLIKAGKGYKAAAENARKTLLDSTQTSLNRDAVLKLYSKLLKIDVEHESATLAAEEAVKSQDKSIKQTGIELFYILVKHGKAFKQAEQIAFTRLLEEAQKSRYNNRCGTAHAIYTELFKNGEGFESAKRALSEIFHASPSENKKATYNDYTLLYELIEKGQAYELAEHAAANCFEEDTHQAIDIYQKLFEKKQGYKSAARTATEAFEKSTKFYSENVKLKNAAVKLFGKLVKESEGCNDAAMALQEFFCKDFFETKRKVDFSFHAGRVLDLYKLLFAEGQGFVSAAELAQVWVQKSEFNLSGIRLFRELVNNKKVEFYPAAISAAAGGLSNWDAREATLEMLKQLIACGDNSLCKSIADVAAKSALNYDDSFLKLFGWLFEKKAAFSIALRTANLLFANELSRHKYSAIDLYSMLISHGIGRDVAFMNATKSLQNKASSSKSIGLRLCSILAKGQKIEDLGWAIQAACQGMEDESPNVRDDALRLFGILIESRDQRVCNLAAQSALKEIQNEIKYWNTMTAFELLDKLVQIKSVETYPLAAEAAQYVLSKPEGVSPNSRAKDLQASLRAQGYEPK